MSPTPRPPPSPDRCISCEAPSKRPTRVGPDGPRTLCEACHKRFRANRMRLFQSRHGRVSARWRPGDIPVVSLSANPLQNLAVRHATADEYALLSLRRKPGRPKKSDKTIAKQLQFPTKLPPHPRHATSPAQIATPAFFKRESALTPPARTSSPYMSTNSTLPSTPARQPASPISNPISPAGGVLSTPPSPTASPKLPPISTPCPLTRPSSSKSPLLLLGKRRRHHPTDPSPATCVRPESVNICLEPTALARGPRILSPLTAPSDKRGGLLESKMLLVKVELRSLSDNCPAAIRLVPISPRFSWTALHKQLTLAFAYYHPFGVSYKDAENDVVLVSSDLDMPGLVQAAWGGRLRMTMTKREDGEEVEKECGGLSEVS